MSSMDYKCIDALDWKSIGLFRAIQDQMAFISKSYVEMFVDLELIDVALLDSDDYYLPNKTN